MPVDVDLTGLEAPRCETEVGGYRSGVFEAVWVINTRLVGQCGDKANPRCRHQTLTDCDVPVLTGPVVELV